jgi:hypothetical protein
MLLLRKPAAEKLRDFLAAQSKLDFTYSAVGATASVPPAGYVVDRTRLKLGAGARTFAAAKAAVERWQHFRLGWVETWPQDTPRRPGRGGDRSAFRPLVAQRMSNRLRRGRGGAGHTIRLRLRHAAATRRVGRGAVHCGVA